MYLTPEDSFWMLVALLERETMGYYIAGMPQLISDSELFHKRCNGIDPLLYVTPWWMCIFTTLVDWGMVLRIWDLVMSEGIPALFRVSLAIITLSKTQLLSKRGAEGLLPYLLRPPLDDIGGIDVILKQAISYPIKDLMRQAKQIIQQDKEEELLILARKREMEARHQKQVASNETSIFDRIINTFTPQDADQPSVSLSASAAHHSRTTTITNGTSTTTTMVVDGSTTTPKKITPTTPVAKSLTNRMMDFSMKIKNRLMNRGYQPCRVILEQRPNRKSIARPSVAGRPSAARPSVSSARKSIRPPNSQLSGPSGAPRKSIARPSIRPGQVSTRGPSIAPGGHHTSARKSIKPKKNPTVIPISHPLGQEEQDDEPMMMATTTTTTDAVTSTPTTGIPRGNNVKSPFKSTLKTKSPNKLSTTNRSFQQSTYSPQSTKIGPPPPSSTPLLKILSPCTTTTPNNNNLLNILNNSSTPNNNNSGYNNKRNGHSIISPFKRLNTSDCMDIESENHDGGGAPVWQSSMTPVSPFSKMDLSFNSPHSSPSGKKQQDKFTTKDFSTPLKDQQAEAREEGPRLGQMLKANHNLGAGSLKPIILVPGIAGSALEAKLDKKTSPSWYCTKKQDWFRLWLSIEELFVQNCWFDNLAVTYDPITGNYINTPGVEIRPMDFGGIKGVSYLDYKFGYPVSITNVYGEMIEFFQDLGYVAGKNIRGAPFDWRVSIPYLQKSGWFDDLQQLIEETYEMNDNQKVVLVAHSMGGITSLYFLQSMSRTWKSKYIDSFVPIAAPWSGSPKAIRTVVSGDNLDPLIWSKDRVFVSTPQSNYTIEQTDSLLSKLGLETTRSIYQNLSSLMNGMNPDMVPTYCIYGYGISTEIGYHYTQGFDKQPVVDETDLGDGTVPLDSLKANM
eukprot:gene3429-3894_t